MIPLCTYTKPLGVLHLADFSILATGADLSRKSKHAFRLSAAESIPHESRHHIFHTETASSLDAWVEAIQTHLDHAQSTLTLPTLGPLDIGLGGPQYSQRSGDNGHHLYAQHPTGDQSIIDKVLDRLQHLGDEHEIDPTLSDMNDPSTLIMPAQEHPSHTLYPFASYTDVSHSNYSSYSDASYGGLKQRMTMQSIEAKSGFGTSTMSNASAISTSSIDSSTGDMSVINLTEGMEQGSSGSSTLRSDNRKNRHQKSDPIPSANDLRISESNHRTLKTKQSMPAISPPGSASGAAIVPSKDGKDIKKSRKLWSGFGGSSTSSSSPSQMLISEPLAIGRPSSTLPPTDPRTTPGLSRSIDTNNPWFKDLILISSPPKPSSIHSAASVAISTSSSKKTSSRGFTSKSMVSLSKSSTPLDHALPPPPSHSHLHEYRDSMSLNRARSPSFSILESSQRHSYQTLVSANANTPLSPKLPSFNRQHHQGPEQFTSDPIPSVGDLLTGFANDEDLVRAQLTTASSTGSRQYKSSPIPTIPITAPLSPRLPAWTRFGDKSQAAHKNTKWSVDSEVLMPLNDEQRTKSLYPAQDLGQQHSQSMEYIAGVSRHILAPVELAQAMEQEEEEARKLKQSREKQGEGLASESSSPPPLPLRRGLTMRQSTVLEPSSQ
ncbi:hypothetical protein BG000_007569, partial [Podila horticola]